MLETPREESTMKRHNIEFPWAWFDALRRRDTETMVAALAPDVVWQGVRERLVCNGPAEVVVETFVSGYDANQEIDSLELLGGERHIVLGVHAPDLGEIGEVEIGQRDLQRLHDRQRQDHPNRGLPPKRRGARRGRPHLDPPRSRLPESRPPRPAVPRACSSVSHDQGEARPRPGRDRARVFLSHDWNTLAGRYRSCRPP
jgi:hypothetical protein